MGDYTLGHFNFTLKGTTPKQVIEVIRALADGAETAYPDHKLFKSPKIRSFFRLTSAYHSEESYFLMGSKTEDRGYATPDPELENAWHISTTFQIKYGWGEFLDFVDWISPYVVRDSESKGCVGYMMTEYSMTPHYLFVK